MFKLDRSIGGYALAWGLLAAAFLGVPGCALAATPSIIESGAKADGATLCTAAIQKAIDEVAAGGGGTLLVPAGTFLTGALFLKPGVNLHLDKGAVLLGSTNIEDYPKMNTRIEGHFQIWRPALLNAEKADHLRIDGPGSIQGGGKPYWDAFWDRRKADKTTKNLDVDRPRNLFIRDSNDVVLSGFALHDSGFWNLHLYRCRGVVVENLDIVAGEHSPSTDGIDIDSCQDVSVSGCSIAVNDDGIALKGSKGPLADQDKDSPPVEHIRIRDCTFVRCGGVLTTGSEATVVRDVRVEHCRVLPGTTNVLRLKLRTDTPQIYSDIHIQDLTLEGNAGTLISALPWSQYFDLQGHAPPAHHIDDITLSDIKGSFGRFGAIAGPPGTTVGTVTLENIDLKLVKPVLMARGVDHLVMKNVVINGAAYVPEGTKP